MNFNVHNTNELIPKAQTPLLRPFQMTKRNVKLANAKPATTSAAQNARRVSWTDAWAVTRKFKIVTVFVINIKTIKILAKIQS